MNNVKLTLEDGREFEVGEVVKWKDSVGTWVKETVGTNSLYWRVSLDFIARNPDRIRKLTQRTFRKMDDSEFLALLRKYGAGIEVKLKTGVFVGNTGYTIRNGNIKVSGRSIDDITHYRTSDDGYTEEHELTVEVEE